MSSTQAGSGQQIQFTTTVAVAAGAMVVISTSKIGFAAEDIAAGGTGPVWISGEWSCPKAAAATTLGGIPVISSAGSTTLHSSAGGTAGTNAWFTATNSAAATTCKVRLF
jgi:predicted RecA/RadA family phage recombinase